jgi:hypothetical protein
MRAAVSDAGAVGQQVVTGFDVSERGEEGIGSEQHGEFRRWGRSVAREKRGAGRSVEAVGKNQRADELVGATFDGGALGTGQA